MRTRWALLFGVVLGLLVAAALGLGIVLGRRDGGLPGARPGSDVGETRRTAIVRASEIVAPSVVSVIALERQVVAGVDPRAQDYFQRFFPDAPTFHSEYVPRFGSGIVLDSKGFFLTNHHLVGNAVQIWVTLPDGREFEAEVVGTDAKYDLAVIKVKQQGSHVFETAPIASADDLMVGEWVVALGNPFGNLLDPRPSVTVGVVSALHRDVRYGEGEAIYKDMIQTDAAINPGNSGGPLVNADGEVVGINTFIFSPAGGSVGIGFAIPISIALGAAEELILYGHVRGVWVGIAVQPLTGPLADQLGVRTRRRPRGMEPRTQLSRRPRGIAARGRHPLGERPPGRERHRGAPVHLRRAGRRHDHLPGGAVRGSHGGDPGDPRAVASRAARTVMIERYCRPEMARLWSEEEKLRTWLEVELAVVEALERYDEAPAGTAARIRERAVIDPARAAALEATLKHDVIAFLTSISERLGDESRWLHFGMTSSDLLDTALALTTRRAAMLVRAGVRALAAVVRAQAEAHRDTAMVGRSHGVHAEPTTFGLKMLLWYAELGRQEDRLLEAVGGISRREDLRRGRHVQPPRPARRGVRLPPAGAEPRSGLHPGHPARPARGDDARALANLSASLEKFATEIRNLQRTEILEAEEPFTKGQKGSSAMPHKRNPITCERVAGLARRGPGQRDGRARKRGPVARAGHHPLLGRARDLSRQLPPRGLPARPDDAGDGGARGLPRAHDGEPGAHRRARVLAAAPPRADPSAACGGRTPTRSCRRTRWPPGREGRRSASACARIRASSARSAPPKWTTSSTSRTTCAT